MNFQHDSKTAAELFKQFATDIRLKLCGQKKKIKNEGTTLEVDFDYTLPENRERLFLEIWKQRASEWVAVESMVTYYGTMEALVYRLKEARHPISRKFKVLSLGAGPGLYEIFLAHLLRETRMPATVYALDFAAEMIAFQRAVLAEKTIKIEGATVRGLEQQGIFSPVVADMSDLGRFAGQMDVVIVNNSLQWVADWRQVVGEIGKAMRPEGGKAIVVIHPHQMRIRLEGQVLERELLTEEDLMDEMNKAKFEGTWSRMMAGGPGSGQSDTSVMRKLIEFKFCPQGARDWRNLKRSIDRTEHFQVHD